ncbi:Protein DGCR14 [Teratosphaeria destructans]|uniref:Protein DGCR14 n=1 Tax=Teratosphaeria destructans TaxID=418781 RepID=A0A9W7T1J0_9PEZI|nr:Protein DGCR14 [Teratosphaeria destructans]
MALTKCESDLALMPPPPPPKRQKRPATVLDEDLYSDALSHIIARDFFPGLLETEAQQEYMQALESDNKDWIREAGRNLKQVMTPGPDGRRRAGRGTGFTPRRTTTMGETPRNYVGETPGQTPKARANDDFAPEEKPAVDVNISLGAFQAKYTSEDNESFNALLDKQNEKRTAKYAFFHNGNKILAPRQIALKAREQKLLETGQSSSSNALITTNAAGEEVKMISAARPSEDLDSRPASLDSFPNREGPRNHFMFGPEGVEYHSVTVAQQREQISNAPPKSVVYAATRFQQAATQSDNVPHSPSISAIDAAIKGRSKAAETESGYSGAETPRVNGYAFVDAEPTPSEMGLPVTDEEADAAEREDAIKFLPKVEEGGPNPFKIHERSSREELHHRLVEKADASRRKQGGGRVEELRRLGITPGRTPTPRFKSAPDVRKGNMTPAARMLAVSIGKKPKRESGIGGGFGSGGQVDWTPTPRVKR